jgi:hypothetical protein
MRLPAGWYLSEAVMMLELQGNIVLDRAPTRRWVSIIAVVIPAAAFGMFASWFIRAYVAPPMVKIPSPMIVASAAPQMPVSAESQIEAPMPDAPAPLPVVSQAPEPDVAQVSVMPPAAEPAAPPPTSLPMLQALSVELPATSPPPAEQAQEQPPMTTGVAQATMIEAPGPEAAEPIAGPVPLPRSKPRISLARIIGPVPLPRPKPAEDLPPPDLPEIDIHAIQ